MRCSLSRVEERVRAYGMGSKSQKGLGLERAARGRCLYVVLRFRRRGYSLESSGEAALWVSGCLRYPGRGWVPCGISSLGERDWLVEYVMGGTTFGKVVVLVVLVMVVFSLAVGPLIID